MIDLVVRLFTKSVPQMLADWREGQRVQTKVDGFQAIVEGGLVLTKKRNDFSVLQRQELAYQHMDRIRACIGGSICTYKFEVFSRAPGGPSDLPSMWQGRFSGKEIRAVKICDTPLTHNPALWDLPEEHKTLESIWHALHTEEGVVSETVRNGKSQYFKSKLNMIANICGLHIIGGELHPYLKCYCKFFLGFKAMTSVTNHAEISLDEIPEEHRKECLEYARPMRACPTYHVVAMSDFSENLSTGENGKVKFDHKNIRDFAYGSNSGVAKAFNALNAVLRDSKCVPGRGLGSEACVGPHSVFSTSSRMHFTKRAVFLEDPGQFVAVVGPNLVHFGGKKDTVPLGPDYYERLAPHVRMQAMGVACILENSAAGQRVLHDLHPVPYDRFQGKIVSCADPANLAKAAEENTCRMPSRVRHYELLMPGIKPPTIQDLMPAEQTAKSTKEPTNEPVDKKFREAVGQMNISLNLLKKRMLPGFGIGARQVALNDVNKWKTAVVDMLQVVPDGLKRKVSEYGPVTVQELIDAIPASVQADPVKRQKR